MKSPDSQQTVPNRQAGRSFSDPNQPMGEALIELADPHGGDQSAPNGRPAGSMPVGHGVAERAKAISVLRKAEELMASGNPDGGTDAGRRRALELACGRCGVKIHEFDLIVASDPEIQALMTNVLTAANAHAVKL